MRQSFLILAILLSNMLFSQVENKWLRVGDDWFLNYGSKGLKVGDTMPDISLGAVINNLTGKQRFLEFKGTLLILDFWTTGCSVCFDQFPYMEKLQQEFGNKIQILLVNPIETQQQIQKELGKVNRRRLPNLPSLVADEKFSNIGERIYDSSQLYKLFPFRNVPHHVWIDGDSIIRLIGGHENTYAKKIRDLLEGKQISYLKSTGSVPDLDVDRTKPYFKLLGSLKSTYVSYGSFITPYNNEITGGINQIIDSNSNTLAEYFINQNLLTIYEKGPFRYKLFNQNRKIIYRPFSLFGDLVIFPKTEDISRLSSDESMLHRRPTDEDYLRGRYCYEQVVPLSLPDSIRRHNMFEDLNRFTATYLGLVASLEKVRMACYVIVRTSKADKVRVSSQEFKPVSTSKAEIKKTITYAIGESLGDTIDWTIRKNAALQFFMEQNKKKGDPFLIINETGWDKDRIVNMELPAKGLHTIDDLRIALKPYDLDIIKNEREIECVVFKKVKL